MSGWVGTIQSSSAQQKGEIMPANRLSTQLTHSAFIFHSHIFLLFFVVRVLLTRRRHFSLDSAIHILFCWIAFERLRWGAGVEQEYEFE